jgi:hypothetical protein
LQITLADLLLLLQMTFVWKRLARATTGKSPLLRQ